MDCKLKIEVLSAFNLNSVFFFFSNIQAAPIGISRGVKKLIQTKLPNMAQLSDISDYVLRYSYITQHLIFLVMLFSGRDKIKRKCGNCWVNME